MQLDDAIIQYLLWKKQELGISSLKSQQNALARFENWCFNWFDAGVDISQVNSVLIRQYQKEIGGLDGVDRGPRAKMTDKKSILKGGVVNKHMGYIDHLMRYGQEQGRCKSIMKPKPLRNDGGHHPLPSIDETREIMSLIRANIDERKQRRDTCMMYLLGHVGIRAGELVNLTVSDFDFASGTFTHVTKGQKIQVAIMNTLVKQAVLDRLEVHPRISDYLICSLNDNYGGKLGASSPRGIIQTYCKRLGIRKLVAHSFKRFFLTELNELNTPAKELQILGNHDLFSTTAIYIEPSHKKLRSYLDQLPIL